VIVVDASVLAAALGDDGADGDQARARLLGERLVAPHLIDLEVASVWRRQLAIGALDARRVQFALDDLAAIPMRRAAHDGLPARCWQLRENLPNDPSGTIAGAAAGQGWCADALEQSTLGAGR
jgi:predicted nucleic acid-binding protein